MPDPSVPPTETADLLAGDATDDAAGEEAKPDARDAELEAMRAHMRHLQEELAEARERAGERANPEPDPDPRAEARLAAEAGVALEPAGKTRRAGGDVTPTATYGVVPAELELADGTTKRGLLAFGYGGGLWHVPRFERWPLRAMRALEREQLWDALAFAIDKATPPAPPQERPLDAFGRPEPSRGERFLEADMDVIECAELLAELAEAQGADPSQFKAYAQS